MQAACVQRRILPSRWSFDSTISPLLLWIERDRDLENKMAPRRRIKAEAEQQDSQGGTAAHTAVPTARNSGSGAGTAASDPAHSGAAAPRPPPLPLPQQQRGASSVEVYGFVGWITSAVTFGEGDPPARCARVSWGGRARAEVAVSLCSERPRLPLATAAPPLTHTRTRAPLLCPHGGAQPGPISTPPAGPASSGVRAVGGDA